MEHFRDPGQPLRCYTTPARPSPPRDAARRLGDVEVSVTGALLVGRWLLDQGRAEAAAALLQEGLRDAEALSLAPQVAQIRTMLESIAR